MRLQNKWIVVTGGSSGIGAAIAELASKDSNRITIVADHDERLTATRDALRARGANVDAIRCDLGVAADVDALAAQLLASGSAPDVLINNAGAGTYRTFQTATIDEIDRLLNVNLVGHVRLTKFISDAMAARGSGAICFMSSIAGKIPITPNASYCSAKHGMVGLADALRYEFAQAGIEITSVCPGRVATNFFDHETFQTRTTGPENASAMPASRVAIATLRTIEANRRITYVPAGLGFGTWLFETFPFVVRPLFARVMKSRMDRIYADARR